MAKGIIAQKLGMTRVFDEAGNSLPVTVLRAGPCRVLQVKSAEKEGYEAIQLGFAPSLARRVSKAERGHQKGAENPLRILREFRDAGDYQLGQELRADVFAPGDRVRVIGVSKGKGFQGPVKRYGFGGGRATHGSGFHRAPGSLGAHTYPGRVFKGKRMGGHMGVANVTVRNLQVVLVDAVENLILIKGAVPGPRSAIVQIEAL
ncbi:MAG: 50S ribosomal protein L3 [Leptospirales bacterium]|nr:50S ribosomal protein L3 [Leptospirales bacterium]